MKERGFGIVSASMKGFRVIYAWERPKISLLVSWRSVPIGVAGPRGPAAPPLAAMVNKLDPVGANPRVMGARAGIGNSDFVKTPYVLILIRGLSGAGAQVLLVRGLLKPHVDNFSYLWTRLLRTQTALHPK